MKHALTAALASAIAIGGCAMSSDEPAPAPARDVAPAEPAPLDGTFTLEWTIDGSIDPNRCTSSWATTIEITLFDRAGTKMGVFREACRAFATSVALAAGSYSAVAVLLDASGQPRTATVNVHPFNIAEHDELRIPIDFQSALASGSTALDESHPSSDPTATCA